MNRTPRILIATTNRGKAGEFADLLPFDAELVTLSDLSIEPPNETGTTFTENATHKALAGNRASGLITIADDSGICVEALGGAPGILSARYSGENATDASNRALLLTELQDVEPPKRGAWFEAAVVVAYDNTIVATGTGRTYGSIYERERGEHGFGYDSIFLLPDGRTMAELPSTLKNEISHRSKATAQVIPALVRLVETMAERASG
jgi:XTP/dITP diphosphohydrolase